MVEIELRRLVPEEFEKPRARPLACIHMGKCKLGRDSNLANAAKESAHAEFPHGLSVVGAAELRRAATRGRFVRMGITQTSEGSAAASEGSKVLVSPQDARQSDSVVEAECLLSDFRILLDHLVLQPPDAAPVEPNSASESLPFDNSKIDTDLLTQEHPRSQSRYARAALPEPLRAQPSGCARERQYNPRNHSLSQKGERGRSPFARPAVGPEVKALGRLRRRRGVRIVCPHDHAVDSR